MNTIRTCTRAVQQQDQYAQQPNSAVQLSFGHKSALQISSLITSLGIRSLRCTNIDAYVCVQ